MSKLSKEEKREMLKAMGLMTQISVTILACIAVGFFVGRALDNWLSTEPWLLLVFIFLGIVASIKYFFDLAKKF